MAEWIEAFTITVPPGTSKPGIVFPTKFTRPAYVEKVTIVIPDGLVGKVGFQILFGNTVVVPSDPNKYIIANNATIEWQFYPQYSSGDWSIRAYNDGGVEHNIYFYFSVVDAVKGNSNISPLSSPTAQAIMSLTG